MEAKLVRVLVASSTEGKIFTQDAIQIGDELWLAQNWLQSPDGRWRTPAVAIRVDSLGVQSAPNDFPAELMLTTPAPTAVLECDPEAARAAGLAVEEHPSGRLVIPVATLQ